jgi:hypothetical protein
MFPLFGFSIQEFFICYFYCQKTAFVCEFQHTPLWKIIFFSMSTPLVDVRFCTHVPNSTRNKNVKSSKPYLCPKMVFLAHETLLSLILKCTLHWRRVQKISITLAILVEFFVISLFHETKIPTVDMMVQVSSNFSKKQFKKNKISKLHEEWKISPSQV